jgi:hypothetical protein
MNGILEGDKLAQILSQAPVEVYVAAALTTAAP